MRLLYFYRTAVGRFYIGEERGRFHVIFGSVSFGSYSSPQEAAQDLAWGRTDVIGPALNTRDLRISAKIENWTVEPL